MSNFEVYKDEVGQYRWRLRANNGEIVAVGEAYTREEDAFRGAEDAKKTMGDTEVEDADGLTTD